MRKHTLLIGALSISAMVTGCGGDRRGSGGTEGARGTSGAAMTLRGCVEAGSPPGTYVLRTLGSQARGEGDTAGTSGTRLNQAEGKYRLIATGSMDIGENLGKEVSVTGELATQAQDDTGAGGTSGTARNDQQGSANNDRFFRVTSIAKVSDSCAASGAREGGNENDPGRNRR